MITFPVYLLKGTCDTDRVGLDTQKAHCEIPIIANY